MVNGEWSMVNGEWAMVNGEWAMVYGQLLLNAINRFSGRRDFLIFYKNEST